jgi:streptogramin lyase
VGVLWAHVESPPPSLTEERPDLPPEVDDVVALAMAKDPAERTAAAGDVAAGFRSALGLEAPPVGLPTVRRPRAKPKKPRRRWVIAGVAAGVALLAAAGILLLRPGGGAGDAVPSASSLARIDATTNAFAATMQVGEDPTGVAIGEDGDVWVINQGDSTVNRIDPETGEVTPAKSTLGIPTGIAAGEGAVWITNGFGSPSGPPQVVNVDPTTESVELAFPSSSAKAIVAAFGSIWLADADRDLVLRYDPGDLGAAPEEVPTDESDTESAAPRFLAVGSGAAEGIWVVSELGGTILRIDPETNEVADRISVDSPTAVAADDSGVWVTSEAHDQVQRFDPVDGTTLVSLGEDDGIPDGPTAIAIGTEGVWVASDLEPVVVRIDPATNVVVDRLAIGGITGAMTADPDGNVWVTVREQAV